MRLRDCEGGLGGIVLTRLRAVGAARTGGGGVGWGRDMSGFK